MIYVQVAVISIMVYENKCNEKQHITCSRCFGIYASDFPIKLNSFDLFCILR